MVNFIKPIILEICRVWTKPQLFYPFRCFLVSLLSPILCYLLDILQGVFFGVKGDASPLGLRVSEDRDSEDRFVRVLLTKLLDGSFDSLSHPLLVSLPISRLQ
jgi:hypothetical protein